MAHVRDRHINKLREIAHLQRLVKEQQEEYVFITLKQVWRNLVAKELYFKSYLTFIREMGEGALQTRIETLTTLKVTHN